MAIDPRAVRGFQAVAGIVAVMILVQAILAGQFITGAATELRDAHRFLGYTLFMATLAQLALAWISREAWRYRMVAWSAVILLLTVAQTAMGDINRSDPEPDLIAVHIPLGVFLFALSSIVAMLAMMDERAKDALRGSS